jgi:hypothetical protein
MKGSFDLPEIHFSGFEKKVTINDKVVKFAALHGKSGDYLRNMFGEQFAYGHREILLKYCGLDFSTQLLGNLQHGVHAHEQKIDFRSPRYSSGRKSLYWVFSKTVEELGRKSGHTNIRAIGAPWFYLRDSINLDLENRTPSGGVLIMLSHSQSTAFSVSTLNEKSQRAKALRAIVGPSAATVCLHAVDFCDPETTNAFKGEGFDVTCIGSSSFVPRWSQSGNRIRSLYTLLNLMMSHTKLLTDDYGSHLFYAIDMGLEIGIHTDLRDYLRIEDALSGRTKHADLDDIVNNRKYLRDFMPESINGFTDSKKYQALADEKLGRDSVLTPHRLLDVLHYRKNVYPVSTVQPW